MLELPHKIINQQKTKQQSKDTTLVSNSFY